MRLSTKSRFAVTAMIDMAMRHHLGPVSLAAISQRQHISISYLEQIFSKMRQHGLVESTRGPGGGYTLNRDANHISVADIIRAVHGNEEKAAVDAQAEANGFVSTHALWSQLNQQMEEHMERISLQSLVAEQLSKSGLPPITPSPKRGVFVQKPTATKVNTQTPNSVFALGQLLVNSR